MLNCPFTSQFALPVYIDRVRDIFLFIKGSLFPIEDVISRKVDQGCIRGSGDLSNHFRCEVIDRKSHVRFTLRLVHGSIGSSVYDDPRLMEPDPYFSNERVMEQLKLAMARLVSKPVWPQHTDLWMKLGSESVFNVLEGTETPEQALKKAADEIRATM